MAEMLASKNIQCCISSSRRSITWVWIHLAGKVFKKIGISSLASSAIYIRIRSRYPEILLATDVIWLPRSFRIIFNGHNWMAMAAWQPRLARAPWGVEMVPRCGDWVCLISMEILWWKKAWAEALDKLIKIVNLRIENWKSRSQQGTPWI